MALSVGVFLKTIVWGLPSYTRPKMKLRFQIAAGAYFAYVTIAIWKLGFYSGLGISLADLGIAIHMWGAITTQTMTYAILHCPCKIAFMSTKPIVKRHCFPQLVAEREDPAVSILVTAKPRFCTHIIFAIL
jgi:hypothetical protein